MDAQRLIITRQLPKTGQTVEYVEGDDGTYEAGWWLKRLNVNNKTRFIVKGDVGSKVTLDRATGLMWATEGDESGCYDGLSKKWETAISHTILFPFAGYSDWRLPNVLELVSIVNFKVNMPSIYTDYFTATESDKYWTSTTVAGVTTHAYIVIFGRGAVSTQLKTNSAYARYVRGGL